MNRKPPYAIIAAALVWLVSVSAQAGVLPRDLADTGLRQASIQQNALQEATAAGEIDYGQTVREQIRDSAGVVWEFSGSTGDEVIITLTGDFDTFLELYDPDDRLVVEDDDSAGDFNARIERHTLSESGTYRIVARGFEGETGTYALTLTETNSAARDFFSSGRELLNDRDYAAAIVAFNRAIKLNPQNAAFLNNRAFAHVQLEQWEQAIEDLNRAIELNPGDAVAHNNRGFAFEQLGQLDRARADYDRALQIDPDFTLARNNRERIAGETASARATPTPAARATQTPAPADTASSNADAEDFFNSGMARLDINELTAAVADFSRAIDLDPDFTQAYFNRGNAYRQLSEFSRAIEDYTRAIALNPDFAEAYNNRGNVHLQLREFNQAIDDYTRAIDLNPRFTEAFNNRGNAYLELGEFNDAIADYTRAINLDPRFVDAFNNRGVARLQLGQFDAAIEDFDQALNINPNFALARANRERAIAQRGR